jgi:Zn-dependent protease
MPASDAAQAPAPVTCPRCGTQVAARLLHCPSCKWLVHAEALREQASRAEQAHARGDLAGAREAWRRALELLPRSSAQHAEVARRIDEIGLRIEKEGLPDQPGDGARPVAIGPGSGHDEATGRSRGALGGVVAGAAGIGLLLWKFKAVLAFLLTKGKLLLLGLTKSSTFFSMLLSLGVYWSVFGWMFALGLVLSIYVHEIGHVAALHRLGIRASAPMFIPGLGALVRLKEYPASPREDARVGLAGPIWGLGASLFAFALFHATGWPIFAAIARVGAWLNLFNLIPVWQLDGSRGFRALSRHHRWLVVAAAGVVGLLIQEMLYLLIAATAAFHAFGKSAPEVSDRRTLLEFLLLLSALGALCAVTVPGLS